MELRVEMYLFGDIYRQRQNMNFYASARSIQNNSNVPLRPSPGGLFPVLSVSNFDEVRIVCYCGEPQGYSQGYTPVYLPRVHPDLSLV